MQELFIIYSHNLLPGLGSHWPHHETGGERYFYYMLSSKKQLHFLYVAIYLKTTGKAMLQVPSHDITTSIREVTRRLILAATPILWLLEGKLYYINKVQPKVYIMSYYFQGITGSREKTSDPDAQWVFFWAFSINWQLVNLPSQLFLLLPSSSAGLLSTHKGSSSLWSPYMESQSHSITSHI